MDTRPWQTPRLLAERARRNGKVHHCPDDRGQDIRGRASRCFLLLLPRLGGQKQPSIHLPHHWGPTCTHVARMYAEFRSIFVPLIQSDPDVAHESLYGQMHKLIVQPLVKSAISTVILIDALDECKDDEPASAILSVLGQFVNQIPRVKFFVTGRPEPWIREGFRLPLLVESTDVFVLHEVELSWVNSDIRLFFGHTFLELKGRRCKLGNWPTGEQLDLLCERTGGLFVHAMATTRLISQKNTDPKEQLNCLL